MASRLDPSRLDPDVTSLRRHAASGTVINSGFQVGLAGLGLIQRLAVAAFLTRAEFGLWGVVLTIVITLAWLKDTGVVDKYIQQSEPDQELAFQKAFSLEFASSWIYFAIVAIIAPAYALAYGRSDVIVPVIVLALAVPISTFESPAWIAYRRMQYLRQRVLTATDPVVSFIVTIALGVAGLGYWCLVIGILAGSLAGAAVCVATSPYPLRLRFSRETLREYASFSWPLIGGGLSRLLIVQGTLIAATRTEGIAAVGSIGLAISVVIFADRVDQIVSETIYPAVCAVVERRDVLYETFVKTNRIALMWAIPFATAVALFAHDLALYVLGDKWLPATSLMAALALSSGIGQLAFNWGVFMRALGRTRPIFVAAVVDLAVFAAVSLPAIVLFGVSGYAVGFWVTMLGQLVVRNHYMTRLFPEFSIVVQFARAVAPTLPAALLILGTRAAFPDPASLGRAITEAVAFCGLAAGFTFAFERNLIREMSGYLLRRRRAPEPAVS